VTCRNDWLNRLAQNDFERQNIFIVGIAVGAANNLALLKVEGWFDWRSCYKDCRSQAIVPFRRAASVGA
jgi:hypothetical protein